MIFTNKRAYWIISLILLAIGLLLVVSRHRQQVTDAPSLTASPNVPAKPSPIDQADKRVTKKPFGIYITPTNSPVSPEKFTGYHTGTDFETFADEANADVPFYAICDGKILQKRTASGYGGIIVQSCTMANESVTVVYGHVSLKNISKNIGDQLAAGEKIGLLGKSPEETDGERKHLHLGIHKGTGLDIKGYVQSQSALSAWIDFQKLN